METFRAFTYMDIYGRLVVTCIYPRLPSMCAGSWLMRWMCQSQRSV